MKKWKIAIKLIKTGNSNPGFINSNNHNALLYAVLFGNLKVIRLLIIHSYESIKHEHMPGLNIVNFIIKEKL